MGIGGVETGVRNIADYLNKQNIKNFILCEKSKENFKNENFDIFYLNNLRFKNPFHQNKIKIIIKKIILKYEINLVHISSRAPAFFLLNYLKKFNIKLVTSIHSKYSQENFIKAWYNSYLLKGDHVIFNSYFVKNSYLKLLDLEKKSSVISRGVDLNYFRSNKILDNIKIKFLFIPSRISGWKGHDLLINYFSKLPQKYKSSYKLLFISSHSSNYELKLDELINKKRLSNYIEFIRPTLDIKNLYEISFLVLNFSIRPEGFGRTISEALSMRRAVIAPNFGGTKEQLEFFDKNLLFDIGSFRSFKRSLDYAISNHKDITKKSRSYVKKHYSSLLMCQKTLEIYNKLISQ